MTRYCGREFSSTELFRIQSLIKDNPQFNRSRLSREVCEMFRWLKPDGKLKDMSCRVAMLRMHEDGQICLPPPTRIKHPVRKVEPTSATDQQTPILCSVELLPKLHFKIVTKKNSALWNEYIERYHYLGVYAYLAIPLCQVLSCAISSMQVNSLSL